MILTGVMVALALISVAVAGQNRRVAASKPIQARGAGEALRRAAVANPQEDEAAALHRLRRAADQGDAQAQSRLGYLYQVGRGVPQDYAQALYWYRRAAEQGDVDALYHLGRFYERGWGVPQSYATSLSWYRRAARRTRGQDMGTADAPIPLIQP
jgi:TPR repeat protein